MSTYFDAPISGSGNGTIVINAKTLNNGSSSRSAVLTISNGEKTANSTLSQRFKPTFQRSGSGNIPSSGGSMTVSVNSQYPFYFRNNPSNIGAITSGGVDYKDNPSINGGSWTFNVSVGANATTSGKTETLEMAFQKLDGTYSFNNPDAGDYSFTFYQESGSTTPIGIISISTPANVAASATSIPYSVTANMQSTINTFKDNVSYSTFSVQSGTTSGNLSISANGNSASPITYRFEGSTSDNQGFATASTIQNAADAPAPSPSGTTINVPVYFDYDGDYIYVCLGSVVPFDVYTSIELTYRNGKQELLATTVTAGNDRAILSYFGGTPVDFSIFDTSDLNYASITSLYFSNGAPEMQTTYGDDEYYLWWSEDYSSNFKTYLENVGNDCLDGVTWGEPPVIPVPYEQQYFTIEAMEDGKLTWNISGVTYSLNDGTWNEWDSGTSLSIVSGDTVRFKSDTNTCYSGSYITFKANPVGNVYKSFNVYGNIMSLLYGDNFASATTLPSERTFQQLFWGENKLISAEHLILPATTLTPYCYYNMFLWCNRLINAPVLPATTLAERCYWQMFRYCTSLTTAPALPATTLAPYCYSNMFQNCTSLVNAPALPATTLETYCYSSMFSNCTSLTQAPELPASACPIDCYLRMFQECTSLQTAPELPATTLGNYCYYGMFSGCTSLENVQSALPATQLSYYCYGAMFRNCTSLTTAPALPASALTESCYREMFSFGGLTQAPSLPATTLAVGCYEWMLAGCPITEAPELPATTLANYCYWGMFGYCSNLETAPALPASALTIGSYGYMFRDCTNLDNIKCLATDISATDCTNSWTLNVASAGTFVKAAEMSGWTVDSVNGIPSGWTVKEYYNTEYFTIEAISAGTLSWNASGLTYSKNNGAWTEWDSGSTLSVSAGDKVRFKSNSNTKYQFKRISSTGEFNVCGNSMSLFYGDNFENQVQLLDDASLYAVFESATTLISAENLILPATAATKSCYDCMFRSCTSLTSAPALPATTVAPYCYSEMFRGCTSLINIPSVLPATTLDTYCYSSMFENTPITTAPELPAPILANSCYANMFQNCSNLSYIKCLATNKNASYCTSYWVLGVGGTGTFVKSPNVNNNFWYAGTSSRPANFTLVDAT